MLNIKKLDAIKIMFFLMVVDERMDAIESLKFDETVEKVDLDLFNNIEEIVEECYEQIEKSTYKGKYSDIVYECVKEILNNNNEYFWLGDYSGSQLLWDLLCIAVSDEDYSKEEKKIIMCVVEKLKIEQTVLLEMENAIKTVLGIDKEIDWLEKADKPYEIRDAIIAELNNRKTVICNSMKELIED